MILVIIMRKLSGPESSNMTAKELTVEDVINYVRCLEEYLKENEELQVKMLDVFISTFEERPNEKINQNRNRNGGK